MPRRPNDSTAVLVLCAGPAYNSKQLDKGDVVVEIDGKPVTNDNLSQLLVGSDIAGTAVTISVRKGGKTGTKKSVNLLRMPSEAIADRRRLFELFTASELPPIFVLATVED